MAAAVAAAILKTNSRSFVRLNNSTTYSSILLPLLVIAVIKLFVLYSQSAYSLRSHTLSARYSQSSMHTYYVLYGNIDFYEQEKNNSEKEEEWKYGEKTNEQILVSDDKNNGKKGSQRSAKKIDGRNCA